MSTDPTGLGNDNCIEATKKKYVNLDLNKNNWCGYNGVCYMNNMVFDKEIVCYLCKYRIPLDIPQMLNKKLEERRMYEILWRKFK